MSVRDGKLYCDGPECPLNGAPVNTGMLFRVRLAVQRRMADRKHGWHRRGRFDFCPACWEEMTDDPEAWIED